MIFIVRVCKTGNNVCEQRNLTEYYNAVDPSNMMKIFARSVCEARFWLYLAFVHLVY